MSAISSSYFGFYFGQITLLAILAACISYGLIFILRATFVRYAVAQPNARSSHRSPTPQGGGIGVIGATIVVVLVAAIAEPELANTQYLTLLCAVIALAIVGATDDVRPLKAMPRLLLQVAATALVVAAIPHELRAFPLLPWWIERACILLGCVWFINLANFMDGIDWMTVAEVVPVTAGLAMFGLAGALPRDATIVAIALFGAIIGFAPFNRPVARLFLGDVGSLPIGLILGWMLLLLAVHGHLAAALLLPLYYLADATITLLRRLIKGDPPAQAHRDHFYQRAIDGGFSAYRIVGIVFALNIVLAALAAVSISATSEGYQVAPLAIGSVLVAGVLWKFNSAKR